eukprot:3151761-Rhodomonas_salina.4
MKSARTGSGIKGLKDGECCPQKPTLRNGQYQRAAGAAGRLSAGYSLAMSLYSVANADCRCGTHPSLVPLHLSPVHAHVRASFTHAEDKVCWVHQFVGHAEQVLPVGAVRDAVTREGPCPQHGLSCDQEIFHDAGVSLRSGGLVVQFADGAHGGPCAPSDDPLVVGACWWHLADRVAPANVCDCTVFRTGVVIFIGTRFGCPGCARLRRVAAHSLWEARATRFPLPVGAQALVESHHAVHAAPPFFWRKDVEFTPYPGVDVGIAATRDRCTDTGQMRPIAAYAVAEDVLRIHLRLYAVALGEEKCKRHGHPSPLFCAVMIRDPCTQHVPLVVAVAGAFVVVGGFGGYIGALQNLSSSNALVMSYRGPHVHVSASGSASERELWQSPSTTPSHLSKFSENERGVRGA